ncbi:Na+/H+ antiporter NhaC family protein [Cytophagaceae bacterium ABcell3]|nr:Na+/H+ antiporter NhaC family protein [Cytophagaceae bacterium ABcell3]
MKFKFFKLFLFLILLVSPAWKLLALDEPSIYNFNVEGPDLVLGESFSEIVITALNQEGIRDSSVTGKHQVIINGNPNIIEFRSGEAYYTTRVEEGVEFVFEIADTGVQRYLHIRHFPAWVSLLPPLVAVLLAILLREVVVSLFLSIYIGVLLLTGLRVSNIVPALLNVVDTYIVEAILDVRHLSILLFAFFIGGMVALISKSGGIAGLAGKLSGFVRSGRSAQVASFCLSILLFFDIYANTLINGHSMRAFFDRYRLSREKLAFIVHATASSVTAIGFVSIWIGVQLGYINDAALYLSIEEDAYALFLQSIQYAFYPFFMLFFIIMLIVTGIDFGYMKKAVDLTRGKGVVQENTDYKKNLENNMNMLVNPEKTGSSSWVKAFLPVAVVIVTALVGLEYTGARNSYEMLINEGVRIGEYSFVGVWQNLEHLTNGAGVITKAGVLLANSDFYVALLWGSFSGLLVAFVIALINRKADFGGIIESMFMGFKLMLPVAMVLIFAWAFADVLKNLETSEYLASVFSGFYFPQLIPLLTFFIAALFTFSTGSVLGTMAILYPLLVPASWVISMEAGLSMDETRDIFYHMIAVILTGAVFGNLVSPVSDTAILASIASDCDRRAHVKTQFPYVLLVAVISVVVLLVSILGIHWSLNYLLGMVLIAFLILTQREKGLSSQTNEDDEE